MMINRRNLLSLPLVLCSSTARAEGDAGAAIIHEWFGLILELVRHTATYTPPVASRAFAYLGITAHEALATGDPALVSLAGQVRDLTAVPQREAGQPHDAAAVLQGALAFSALYFFSNTGPTGKRALKAMEKKTLAAVSATLEADVLARSIAHGEAVAAHIIAWSEGDGGAHIINMGFPMEYTPSAQPGSWVPTSVVRQQQAPLLPDWGKVRSFALPDSAACGLPGPPPYSEDKSSAFYQEAVEVYETVRNLTPDQRTIARFWSDDPMLSPTPPGHWVFIAVDLLQQEQANAARCADVLARLGIAIADGFIACWHAKFTYNLLRPVTYIKKHMDPAWEAMLITPPFPEYPSGHSTQSGAAEVVLAQAFGADFSFTDKTHARDGIAPRRFKNFREATTEAGMSRLYGGIHFRAAIVHGLDQGRCIGAYAAALKTRKDS